MKQSRYNVAILSRLVNFWMVFNTIMIFVSYLPHWPLPMISWINISLYFFAFLATFLIAKADEFNRDCFIPLSILFLLYSVPSLFLILIDENALWGTSALSWILYRAIYLTILFVFAYSTFYFASKNALQPTKPYLLNIAAFLLVGVIFYYHFSYLIFNPEYEHYNELLVSRKITYFLLPVVGLILYPVFAPFFKPKYGEYSHSIMVLLTFLCLREFAIAISEMKNIFLFGIDQYFLTITLIFLNILLVKKLLFVTSTAGQVYSKLIRNKIVIPNLKLEGREKKSYVLFKVLMYYLYLRRRLLLPIFFVILFLIKYLQPPFIVSINLFFMTLMIFFVLLFMIHVFHRKEKADDFVVTNNN